MLKRLVIVAASALVMSTAAMAADGASQTDQDKTTVKPGQGQGPTESVGSQVPAEQKAGADDTATQEGDKTKVQPGAGPTESMTKEAPKEK